MIEQQLYILFSFVLYTENAGLDLSVPRVGVRVEVFNIVASCNFIFDNRFLLALKLSRRRCKNEIDLINGQWLL